jgi:hypothetical protein
MKLHLLRHPQPAVAAGLCYGASDIGVDPGALESVLAALRRAGLPGSLPVYTSPLRRCAELARRLAPPELHIDARLAEMDFGAWEMRAWSAIARATSTPGTPTCSATGPAAPRTCARWRGAWPRSAPLWLEQRHPRSAGDLPCRHHPPAAGDARRQQPRSRPRCTPRKRRTASATASCWCWNTRNARLLKAL